MKILMTTILAGLALIAQTQAADKTGAESGKMRIGIYDSRSVVIAYANTPLHKAEMKPLMDAFAQAKASGDKAKMKECEAAGQAVQQRFHRQGFSTAPVDDIMAKITNEVAQIKAKAQVAMLISKWDKATLSKYPEAERIDVTAELIDAFHPDDRQRKFAVDAQKHEPIPLDKIDKEMEKEGH